MKKVLILLLILILIVLAGAAYAAYGTVSAVRQEENEIAVQEIAVQDPIDAALYGEENGETIEIVELSGTITEITDEYVMLDAGEMGPIQANVSDDTLIEGVEELTVGQTAVVKYDGKMTRSIPAQITALHIGVYEVKGTVTAVEEGRVTVTKTEGGDEVVLTLPENAPQIAAGDVITAYTTGVSTMSLPPQMNAIAITK